MPNEKRPLREVAEEIVRLNRPGTRYESGDEDFAGMVASANHAPALAEWAQRAAALIEKFERKCGGDGWDGTLGWHAEHPLLVDARAILREWEGTP